MSECRVRAANDAVVMRIWMRREYRLTGRVAVLLFFTNFTAAFQILGSLRGFDVPCMCTCVQPYPQVEYPVCVCACVQPGGEQDC